MREIVVNIIINIINISVQFISKSHHRVFRHINTYTQKTHRGNIEENIKYHMCILEIDLVELRLELLNVKYKLDTTLELHITITCVLSHFKTITYQYLVDTILITHVLS